MITRELLTVLGQSRKSLLLLGPRQTGKSTLVSGLKPDLSMNLASESTYLDFARDPKLLEDMLAAKPKARTVFIDEIQRLPSLLNTIQVLLDKPGSKWRFLLTGSSARKLRRGHADLLPGRVHVHHLGPLLAEEISPSFSLTRALSYGTLPGIWTEPTDRERELTLSSYAATYLKEEIQAEGLARNIEGFTRFLYFSATAAGQLLDVAKLASLAQIARPSAVRFFEVLVDSLIVIPVEAFAKSGLRRLVQHPRFYFFDTGIWNGLLKNYTASSDRMGGLFEHWIVTQITHMAHAYGEDIRLSFYRTEHGAEVDAIVEWKGTTTAIEIESSRTLHSDDISGLRSFAGYFGKPHRSWIFYQGEHRRHMGNTEVWPWREGLSQLFKR